jgi:hypothetical protein
LFGFPRFSKSDRRSYRREPPSPKFFIFQGSLAGVGCELGDGGVSSLAVLDGALDSVIKRFWNRTPFTLHVGSLRFTNLFVIGV